MTAAADGVYRPTLNNSFTFAQYLAAVDAVAEKDSSYTGLCVYKERPDPTPAPSTTSPTTGTRQPTTPSPSADPTALPTSLPTIDYQELVIVAGCTLALAEGAATSLNDPVSPENAAFRAGMNAITDIIDEDEQCYGVSAASTTARRRLTDSSSSYDVSYNLLVVLDTSDSLEASNLVSNFTTRVQNDLTNGLILSDDFITAVQSSLSAQGVNSSQLSTVQVDKNATALSIEAVVVFVQTEAPTALPTPLPSPLPTPMPTPQEPSGKSKGGGKSSNTTLIIIVVVVGAVVVGAAAAAAVVFTSYKATKVEVYTDKPEQKPGTNVTANKTVPVDGSTPTNLG